VHAGARWSLPRRPVREKGTQMADVAYVALTIGIFALLALMLRGLEKLQ
jgi:hypothetical protein